LKTQTLLLLVEEKLESVTSKLNYFLSLYGFGKEDMLGFKNNVALSGIWIRHYLRILS